MHSSQTTVQVQFADLRGKRRGTGEVLALAYIAIIAELAIESGAFYILFPELAALSHDILKRPRGSWACAPFLLVITPVLTAVLGTLVTRTFPYDYVSVMLAAGGGLAIVLTLRSPIAPAISAGLLPLALGVRSLWYPPGIVFGTILLASLSSILKRMSDEPFQNTIVASEDEDRVPRRIILAPPTRCPRSGRSLCGQADEFAVRAFPAAGRDWIRDVPPYQAVPLGEPDPESACCMYP